MEKCKKCGGRVIFDPNTKNLVCEKCQSEYVISQNKDFDKHPFDMDTPVEENNFDASNFKSHCSSCGATFDGDTFSISDVCAYCGAQLIIDFADGTAPDGCLPFAFDKKHAKQKFKDGLKKKWFLPNKFKKEPPENKIESVYLPAYLCDCTTENNYSGQLYNIHRDNDGNSYRTYRKISGTENVKADNMLVECSSQITQATLGEILPYNTQDIVKFKKEFLYGYSVEYYNRKLENCKQNFKAIASSSVRREILKNYSYDGVDYLRINTTYKDCKYSKVILPSYKVTYKYAGTDYSTFMNGQTGKVGGNLPRSKVKITLFACGVALVLGAIGVLIYLLIK